MSSNREEHKKIGFYDYVYEFIVDYVTDIPDILDIYIHLMTII